MNPAPFLILTVVLAGCATQQQSCILQATKDLRVLDGLIAETQLNLRRGYAVDPAQGWQDDIGPCFPSLTEEVAEGAGGFCQDQVLYPAERPRAIDPKAEGEKLRSLQGHRAELQAAAAVDIARCRKAFPEKDQ